MSPANTKKYIDLNAKSPILTKFWFCRQIFVKVTNIKFYVNPSLGNIAGLCGQTRMGGWTD